MNLYVRTQGPRVFLWQTVQRTAEDRVTMRPVDELLGELTEHGAIQLGRALLAAVPSDCCEACGTLKFSPGTFTVTKIETVKDGQAIVWDHADGSPHSADGAPGCFPCANLRRAAPTFGAVEAQSYAPPRKEPGGIAGHAERLAAHLAEHPLDLTVPKTERTK